MDDPFLRDVILFIEVRRKLFLLNTQANYSDTELQVEQNKANSNLTDWIKKTKADRGPEVNFQDDLLLIFKEAFEKPNQVCIGDGQKYLKAAIDSLNNILESEKIKPDNRGISKIYNCQDVFKFISESIFIKFESISWYANHHTKVRANNLWPVLFRVLNCNNCIKALAISICNYLKNPKPILTGIYTIPVSSQPSSPLSENPVGFHNNIQPSDSYPEIKSTMHSGVSDPQIAASMVRRGLAGEKVISGWKMPNRPLVTKNEPVTIKPAGWVWKAPDKDLPPPPGKQWVESPDGFSEGRDFKNGKIVGAVVRGRSHKQNAVYCDDSFKFSVENDNWQIVVVSDGVGSALLSRFGSDIAVRAATEKLTSGLKSINFNDIFISDSEQKQSNHRFYPKIKQSFFEAFKTAKTAIEELKNSDNNASDLNRKSVDKILRLDPGRNAKRIQNAVPGQLIELLTKDYACTLLAFAVTDAQYERPDGQKVAVKLIASCAVGDGMMGVLRKPDLPQNAMELMGGIDGGLFSGEVVPLTSFSLNENVIFHRTRIDLVGNVTAVVAMTDGVSEDYNQKPSPLGLQQLACDLIINGILPVEGSSEDLATAKLKECNQRIADQLSKAENDIKNLIAHRNTIRNATDQFVIDQKIIKLREIADVKTIEDFFKKEAPLLNPESVNPELIVKYINKFFDLTEKKASDFLSDTDFLKAIRDFAPSVGNTLANALKDSSAKGTDREASLLKLWLDRYVVRGSFDDRTLVIVKFNGAV